MKFHEGILNGFLVTERTRPYRKIYYFQFQRAITPQIHNPELWFLHSARRLMLLYMKISQTVFELQSGHDFVVTDGQTTRAKTICLLTLNGGDINNVTFRI